MLNYRNSNEVFVDAIKELLIPNEGIRFPWWPSFTNLIGGFRPHEITLLCAPTGIGKTQFLANMSAQLIGSNTPHFVAPVETGDTDFLIRVISAMHQKDYNFTGNITLDEAKNLSDAYGKLFLDRKLYISTYENRVDPQEMINLLKYMSQKYGIKMALLDNLNFFLDVVSTTMEKAEMDNTIHDFVILAKKLPIHILLIVHPKKNERHEGRIISEFDIKGSSTAVQEASNVLLFNRPTQDDIEKNNRHPTERELVFRKIRKRGLNVGKAVWIDYKNGQLGERYEAN